MCDVSSRSLWPPQTTVPNMLYCYLIRKRWKIIQTWFSVKLRMCKMSERNVCVWRPRAESHHWMCSTLQPSGDITLETATKHDGLSHMDSEWTTSDCYCHLTQFTVASKEKKCSQRLCFGKKRQINHTWQEWYHVLWRSEVIYHKRKKQQTHVKRSAEFRFKFEGKSSRTEKKLLIGKTHKWMTSHLKAILIYYLIYLFI